MNDTAERVEETVRAAIESGDDIYLKVKEITLKALTERELDRDNIDDVVRAVGKGISGGMGTQYQSAKEVLQQSSKALDDALVSTAEATKLAVEEASSRMDEFSRHDMKKTLEDLKGLEEMFLETIGRIAKDTQGVVSEVAGDLLSHLQIKGTAVGKEAESILEAITNKAFIDENSALSTAKETASTLAKIGSGILAGIAESLQNGKSTK